MLRVNIIINVVKETLLLQKECNCYKRKLIICWKQNCIIYVEKYILFEKFYSFSVWTFSRVGKWGKLRFLSKEVFIRSRAQNPSSKFNKNILKASRSIFIAKQKFHTQNFEGNIWPVTEQGLSYNIKVIGHEIVVQSHKKPLINVFTSLFR